MEQIITDQNFDSFLENSSNTPLVVDFFATWCGPCKKIGPYVEELAQEYAGKVTIGKCDVDDNMDLSARYGIRAVPTILFIKNGEVVDKHVGGATKGELEAKVKSLL